MGGQITYYLSQVLKLRKKKVLVTSNCFSKCSLLISTFKCIIDKNNCEEYSQRPFFLSKCIHKGVKNRCF